MKINRKHLVLECILLAKVVGMCFLNRYMLFAFNFRNDRCLQYEQMSLMILNVNAYDSISFTPDRQKYLLKLIRLEHPDIVCFQELSFESLSKIKPQLDSIYGPCEVLRGDNQMWRLRFYSHLPLRNFSRHKCEGEFDTSDLTDEEKRMIKQSQEQMGVMSAEFEVESGKWVKLFSGHLRSSAYSTARRSMGKDASWFKGLPLYWRNYRIGKRIRDYEAENVRRFIDEAREDGKPVIVAGDLNDWCGSDCLDVLMGSSSSNSSNGSKSSWGSKSSNDQLKDAWWEGGNGFGWTYFGWHLRLRLDHILYSDELELVDVKVIDSDLSDHKPLMARFKLK